MRACAPLLICALALTGCGETTDIIGSHSADSQTPDLPDPDNPDDPNNPDDPLEPRLGRPQSRSDVQIRDAFEQLFFGDEDTQAVYREDGSDAGYIEDINHGDVRTDGIGYGMLVTVELNEQEVFDRLWTWAKRHMLETAAPRRGLLDWRCTTLGANCEQSAVVDATSVIATSLFLAEATWHDTGAHEYAVDANALIDAAVQTESRNRGIVDGVQNLFDVDARLPRRSSAAGDALLQTDYLMPAFYEYWAAWRPDDADFWLEVAAASRRVLQIAPMNDNGLIPFLVNADGSPATSIDYYDEVAARTLLNRWFSSAWSDPPSWMATQNDALLDFFVAQIQDGGGYVSSYYLDGRIRGDINTVAHLSLVATAAAASSDREKYESFLDALAEEPVPEGNSRYYDGMMYLISLLAVSGNLRVVGP